MDGLYISITVCNSPGVNFLKHIVSLTSIASISNVSDQNGAHPLGDSRYLEDPEKIDRYPLFNYEGDI